MITANPRGASPRRAGRTLAPLAFLLVLLWALAPGLRAQLVIYSFGPSATPTTAPTFVASDLSASVFSALSGSPTTGSGAPVFSAGSGGSYFSASAWNATAPGTNYFEFTVTPAAGFEFAATSLSFGYRATSSGPTAFAVRSSVDAFGTNLAAGTFLADTAWHATGTLALAMVPIDVATTFRIYASGASSGLGTLRVDDVTLAGSVGAAAIPEPSTWGAFAGAVALASAAWRRRARQETRRAGKNGDVALTRRPA